MKIAVVAGASGLVGKQLMFKLLESKLYSNIIVLVRNPIPIKHPLLQQVKVNYDQLENYKEELKGDDYYCCLGTTMKKAGSRQEFYKVDFTYCLSFAKVAETNAATSFSIISAVGADPSSSIYYSQVKGKLEEELKKLRFKRLHIFHPSLLMGNRLELRIGEVIGSVFAKIVSPLMFGSLAKFKPIESTQLADALLNIAQLDHLTRINYWTYGNMINYFKN